MKRLLTLAATSAALAAALMTSACITVIDADSGDWQAVPVYERHLLQPGQWLAGPALVVEDETTTHVIAGFEVRLSQLGALILDDTLQLAQNALDHEEAVTA